jgi:hypothetical protein
MPETRVASPHNLNTARASLNAGWAVFAIVAERHLGDSEGRAIPPTADP